MRELKRPLIVYTNVIYALWMIQAVLAKVVQSHKSSGWSAHPKLHLSYDLISLALLLLPIAMIYGLFRLKEWARQLCIGLQCLVVLTGWLIPVTFWLCTSPWKLRYLPPIFGGALRLVAMMGPAPVISSIMIVLLSTKSTKELFTETHR